VHAKLFSQIIALMNQNRGRSIALGCFGRPAVFNNAVVPVFFLRNKTAGFSPGRFYEKL